MRIHIHIYIYIYMYEGRDLLAGGQRRGGHEADLGIHYSPCCSLNLATTNN